MIQCEDRARISVHRAAPNHTSVVNYFHTSVIGIVLVQKTDIDIVYKQHKSSHN